MKYKYANGNAYATFYLLAIGNVCPICHQSREICNRNVHDHDIDLYNGSNINMSMERLYAIFYLPGIALFALSVSVCEILIVKM